MKYKLLKIIDLLGMTFLKPVVLLCYREEPREQLKAIGQWIVIPILAFAVFLGLWTYLAPKYHTKSGEVPTPGVVWDAAAGIWTFHERESAKSDAYNLQGKSRSEQLQQVELRLTELEAVQSLAEKQVRDAQELRDAKYETQVQPFVDALAKRAREVAEARKARIEELREKAELLTADDETGKARFLGLVAQHLKSIEEENNALAGLRAQIEAARIGKFPQLLAAQKAQTRIAEEKQFLTKLADQLRENNRESRVVAAQNYVDQTRQAYTSASGEALLLLAIRMVQSEQRLKQVTDSSYAGPWTLPDQVVRSVICVFCGFFLASVIAIPIGVLCGLSSTFMAAMTPFIALFKPVSPIVWLPIAIIIVGGIIPDPDKNGFIHFLGAIPLVGRIQINPAFIASAITVALCSLWPTLVNTALGVASIEKDHMNIARVLRLGPWSRLCKIIIPSALPLIFAGLRISLGVGWMVLIAAELLSSSEGIGKFVWDMFNNGSSQTLAQMFVVVFVVGFVGLVLDRIMIVCQRLVSFDTAPSAL